MSFVPLSTPHCLSAEDSATCCVHLNRHLLYLAAMSDRERPHAVILKIEYRDSWEAQVRNYFHNNIKILSACSLFHVDALTIHLS